MRALESSTVERELDNDNNLINHLSLSFDWWTDEKTHHKMQIAHLVVLDQCNNEEGMSWYLYFHRITLDIYNNSQFYELYKFKNSNYLNMLNYK